MQFNFILSVSCFFNIEILVFKFLVQLDRLVFMFISSSLQVHTFSGSFRQVEESLKHQNHLHSLSFSFLLFIHLLSLLALFSLHFLCSLSFTFCVHIPSLSLSFIFCHLFFHILSPFIHFYLPVFASFTFCIHLCLLLLTFCIHFLSLTQKCVLSHW